MLNAIIAMEKELINAVLAEVDILIMVVIVFLVLGHAPRVVVIIIAILARVDITCIIHNAIQAAHKEHMLQEVLVMYAAMLALHAEEDIVLNAKVAVQDIIYMEDNA